MLSVEETTPRYFTPASKLRSFAIARLIYRKTTIICFDRSQASAIRACIDKYWTNIGQINALCNFTRGSAKAFANG